MVQSAVAYVVCPAVSSEYPHGRLSQHIFVFDYIFCVFVFICESFARFCQGISCPSGSLGLVHGGKPCFRRNTHQICDPLYSGFQFFSPRLYGNRHTKSEFSIILKQRVGPSRSFSLFIHRIRRTWSRTSPDRRTSSSVGYEHPVSEELSHQFSVRRLSAARASS
ncbi:unknown [Firmicutes bacterium CAG:145]|nr:unknown [Firmicutes bacterium CAG:145]